MSLAYLNLDSHFYLDKSVTRLSFPIRRSITSPLFSTLLACKCLSFWMEIPLQTTSETQYTWTSPADTYLFRGLYYGKYPRTFHVSHVILRTSPTSWVNNSSLPKLVKAMFAIWLLITLLHDEAAPDPSPDAVI